MDAEIAAELARALALDDVDDNDSTTAGTDGGSSSAPLLLRGLVNMGNTCFVNAPLQMLLRLPALRRVLQRAALLPDSAAAPVLAAVLAVFTQLQPPPTPSAAAAGDSGTSTSTTSSSSSGLSGPPPQQQQQQQQQGDAIAPRRLHAEAQRKLHALRKAKGQQHDAEEFMGFLLDSLNNELPTGL